MRSTLGRLHQLVTQGTTRNPLDLFRSPSFKNWHDSTTPDLDTDPSNTFPFPFGPEATKLTALNTVGTEPMLKRLFELTVASEKVTAQNAVRNSLDTVLFLP